MDSLERRAGWRAELTTSGALRVPAIIGVLFWIIKALSTAMGESTSDYLVHELGPVPAVLLGFVVFSGALALQFSRRRYLAVTYWLAVVMVGVFGTMGADVLHVGLGVPYAASVPLCGAALAVVFVAWQRVEGTLSIHSIDTTRREAFYWAAVVATFAPRHRGRRPRGRDLERGLLLVRGAVRAPSSSSPPWATGGST